jgi:hypothetical protein
MKTKTEFFEQYKDPRWQKKRLEIMERDNFTCQSCDVNYNTLNVHHTVPYRKETKPWEYENDELITLCEDCHKEISEIIKSCNTIVGTMCSNIDYANEFYSVLMELDGMSVYELNNIKNVLQHKRSSTINTIVYDGKR